MRTFFYQMDSDQFFANHDIKRIFLHAIDIVFLDALHLFEVLLHDFMNVERYCRADSLVMIHDCLPLNLRMAERTRRHPDDEHPSTRPMWAGDVWRLPIILKEYRPDLKCVMLDCPPTGLFVVSNLDATSDVLKCEYENIVARFAEISLASLGIEKLWSLYPILDSCSFDPGDLPQVLQTS